MKFKRDYKITIQADMNDHCYWSAEHKGEAKNHWDIEDYETILQMLNELRNKINHHIAKSRNTDL